MIVDGDGVAQWVSRRLGIGLCPPFYAVGTEKDGQIVNGILLTCFERNDVRVSVAGAGWTLPLMRALHAYVFGQLGCIRATFVTEQPAVIDYARRLGGKVEGVMRSHFGPGRDGTIIGLLKEEAIYFRVPAN